MLFKGEQIQVFLKGTFELLQFVEQHLGFTRELMKVSENETKKTIKEEQLCK